MKMELKDLKGNSVIWKGNTCEVLDVAVNKNGENVLMVKAEETEVTSENVWTPIDEVRVDVFFTKRPRLFGQMVDAYDGIAKVEWKDADGYLVPFRKDKDGNLLLDKENRPLMTMKVFDCRLNEISLY